MVANGSRKGKRGAEAPLLRPSAGRGLVVAASGVVVRDLEVAKSQGARGVAAGVGRDRRVGRERQRDRLADEVLRPVVRPRNGERDAARAFRALQLDVLAVGLV